MSDETGSIKGHFKGLCRLVARRMVSAFLLSGAVTAAAVLVVTIARLVEQSFMPAVVDWKVTQAWTDGPDLWLTGTMVKARDCDYVPPPRASNDLGLPMRVISYSAEPGASWPVNPHPKQWGPWRVVGGAGNLVAFDQQSRCHFGWGVMSHLGEYDNRPARAHGSKQ